MNTVNEKRRERYYWETHDGHFIPVDDLDDKYIVNIVIKFGKDYLAENGYRRIIEGFNTVRKASNFYH